LLNHWVNAGDELSLVTIASSETDFYQLDSRVRRVTLDLGRASRTWRESVANNFRIIMGLRAFMREAQPDVLLSFIDLVNLRVLAAAFGTGKPVVVSERVDPRQHPISRIGRTLRWLLYRRASAVVVQTPGIAQWASRIVARRAIHVIPNPISDQ